MRTLDCRLRLDAYFLLTTMVYQLYMRKSAVMKSR